MNFEFKKQSLSVANDDLQFHSRDVELHGYYRIETLDALFTAVRMEKVYGLTVLSLVQA